MTAPRLSERSPAPMQREPCKTSDLHRMPPTVCWARLPTSTLPISLRWSRCVSGCSRRPERATSNSWSRKATIRGSLGCGEGAGSAGRHPGEFGRCGQGRVDSSAIKRLLEGLVKEDPAGADYRRDLARLALRSGGSAQGRLSIPGRRSQAARVDPAARRDRQDAERE